VSTPTGPGQAEITTGTVIIGGGPAGLATAACLDRVGESYQLIERGPTVASSWRSHYDRLHLHTPKQTSALPGQPWPKGTPTYPSRHEVVTYLDGYARSLSTPPRTGREVTSVRRVQGSWVTETSKGETFVSQNVVVATSVNGKPFIPKWPGLDTFEGPVVHSFEYGNGDRFHGKRVLVVGFGNSAAEITLDLYERGAIPSVAVRGPVNVIPRDLFGAPFVPIGIPLEPLPPKVGDTIANPIVNATIGDLSRYGLEKLPYGAATQVLKTGQIPMIDVGTLKLIEDGHLKVFPGVERLTKKQVVFTDGRRASFDAIVAGTGYTPAFDFLKEPEIAGLLDEKGRPRAEISGRKTTVPGLYFCGYYVSPTGMLREISAEARRLAETISADHVSGLPGRLVHRGRGVGRMIQDQLVGLR
jgi:indole-3-pyruvate monooxygenase